MKIKVFLLMIISVTVELKCWGQFNDFNDVLTHPIKDQKIILVGKDTHSQRTFLGLIKDNKGDVVFYVVKEFYTVNAALVMHGHSRILFFSSNKKLAAAYYLDDPSELPFKISRNSLYFKFQQNGKEMIQVIKIQNNLPVPLRVTPNDCYWPSKQ